MDERFPVESDPRFSRPKRRGRVVLDARFSSVLDPDFSEEPRIDRYGRRLKRSKDVEAMKALYVLSEDLSKDSLGSTKKKSVSKKDDTSVSEEQKETSIGLNDLDGKVIEWLTFSEEELTSSEDDVTSSDEQSINLASDDLGLVDPEPLEEIPRGEMTSRLAAVNLDWDHIRSVDLFAALGSFVPKGGRILSVRIYPSEFGKKRMEKEDVEGPPRDIFLGKNRMNELNEDSWKKISRFSGREDSGDHLQVSKEYTDLKNHTELLHQDNSANESNALNSFKDKEHSEDEDNSYGSSDDETGIMQDSLKKDSENDFDMTQLRKYQLERLRYYYAIVVCDSVDTAKYIYNQCDGAEYEASANFFDLRFVPDGESFDAMEIRDECLVLPENYVPDEFVTDALKHSRVKLMWDNDDPVYVQIVKRAFSGNEINENDFKAYLASTDSEVSDIEEMKKKYRTLLLETEKDSPYVKDTVVGDMQVTFTPGLNHKECEESSFEHETTLEKYKRKEKERKRKKKEDRLSKRKEGMNGVNSYENDKVDLGFHDPFFSEKSFVSSKKVKRKTVEKEQLDDKEKAELELLMMDDEGLGDGKIQHFDMKDILKMEKKRKKKKHVDTEGLQDNFEIDVNDPRFSAVYMSHHFAIDPANPHFKKTKSMMKILDERRRRMNLT
ncbi:hypothetical protein PCANB_001118 [Pneumocystis canis]|nr:hypothetical protein PCANB_001118 [Pneumocystis canis]